MRNCWITGPLWPYKTAEIISAMTGTLAHRGPDGDGMIHRGPAAFGHRRLAIIDPAGGHQPMVSDTGEVWITFNGEATISQSSK